MNQISRLPKNQRLIDDLPPLTIETTIPIFNGKDWDIFISGEVKNPRTITWQDFLKFDRVKIRSDFHCVTGWSKFDNEWEGVSTKVIAKEVEIKDTAKYVTIAAEGFYTSSVPIETFLDDDVLLAYKLDGESLPVENGGPLRIIVPKKWAWKSVKWVRKIIFTKEQELGFWESRGYHNNANPWGLNQERYASIKENRQTDKKKK